MKTRLAEIIEKRGLERKVVARDLQIERRTLDNYINENTLMNSDIIKRVAVYFHISADYLLGIDEVNANDLDDKLEKILYELRIILIHLQRKLKK